MSLMNVDKRTWGGIIAEFMHYNPEFKAEVEGLQISFKFEQEVEPLESPSNEYITNLMNSLRYHNSRRTNKNRQIMYAYEDGLLKKEKGYPHKMTHHNRMCQDRRIGAAIRKHIYKTADEFDEMSLRGE